MMTEFRHTLESLLNPFFISIILIIAALISSWQLVCARRLLWLALILLLAFSTCFIPRWLTNYLEDYYPVVKDYDEQIRYVAVLSGGQADVGNLPADMILNNASIQRTLAGVRIWRALPKAKLVLSGGGYGHQTPEAEMMKQLALFNGVPEAAILIEDQSENTETQARLLKKQLNDEPFYLVTSAIHMPRSMAFFQDQGLKPIAAPTDFTYYWQDERWQKRYIPNAHNMLYAEIAMHEYLGLLYRSIPNQLGKAWF